MRKELIGLSQEERLNLLDDKLRILTNVKSVKLTSPSYLSSGDEVVTRLLVEIDCFPEPSNGLRTDVKNLCADYGFLDTQVELRDPTLRDEEGNPLVFNPPN